MRLFTLPIALAVFFLPALASAQTPQSAPLTKPPVSAPAPKPAAAPTAKTELLDINTATAEQLDALQGIGEKRSAAIIKGRPYKGKDELYQKGIIPRGVYDKIKDQIIARQH